MATAPAFMPRGMPMMRRITAPRLDSWAQYSWFDNNVKGDDLQGESYKSKGVTASLEMGYAQKWASLPAVTER